MIRFLWSAALAAVLGLVAIYLYALRLRRTTMFFPLRYPEGSWETSSLPVPPREHWISTPDGLRLHAWLFVAPQQGAPLMLYFHGNGGNLSQRAPVASNLAARGISTLLFDWRGYGRSEGSPSESGLFIDALAAYEFARTLSPRLTLYGESLGGPYAAFVARERQADAVVIENSFASLTEVGNALYAPIPVGWTAAGALTTAHWLNQAGRPVLVMHGKPDEVIPFKLGLSLYAQLKVEKELLISETSPHCELANTEGTRYYDTVVRFVSAASGKPNS